MLEELRVENLLLLDRAQLRLAQGLNVITGETGAGKTLLAQALDLLLGGRAGKAVVRRGAAEAYVEGTFSLPPGLAGSELIPADAAEVVLARRVWPDGRTRAYVCGRSATVADLQRLGGHLLSFYGQHEHRKLMLGAAQLDILDAHCGEAQLADRERALGAHAAARHARSRVEELRELSGARERELDLLAFELAEIEAAAPTAEEKEGLLGQRERLRHLEALQGAAAAAARAVAGEEEDGVGTRLAGAARALESVAGIDQSLGAVVTRLEAVRLECEDIVRELRDFLLDLDPSLEDSVPAAVRLQEVEERLAMVARLERKHGGSVDAVLAHAERCRARIEELQNADVALDAAEQELAAAQHEVEAVAVKLRARRRKAALGLARAVRERLAELAMPEASFEVTLSERADGAGPRGADAVELMIAPNPGVPAAPLREIASGGEISRVMLALLSVAHGSEASVDGDPRAAPLLVFDEIDAGIGGHTARAVGEHLRALARGRQILCITHLPQVAALAARHFTIVKDMSSRPARTTVTLLEDETVVGELVRMLGAGEDDRAAEEHARQLLRVAA